MARNEYETRIGDSGIYTYQGDLIGNIEDENLRQDAVDGLNGNAIDDEDQEMLEFLKNNDLEEKTLKELLEISEKLEEHDLDVDRIIELVEKSENMMDNLGNLKEVELGLQKVLDRILLDDLQEDDWDLVEGILQKVKDIEKPQKQTA